MEIELWCHYAHKMAVVKAEKIPVYTTVGSAVKILDCLKPCSLYKTDKCLIGRRVEGAFY